MKHTVYWLTCEDQNIGTWTSIFASREAFEAELVRIMRLAIEQHGEDARKRTKEVEALIAADRIMVAWDVFYEPGSVDPSPLCNPDDYYWHGNEELDFPET